MKPFDCAAELLALSSVVIAGSASAQLVTHSSSSVNEAIDKWSREKGVVVTKEVRDELARTLAFKFVTGAPEVGLRTADAWHLGGVIADGGTVESTSTGFVRGRSRNGTVTTYASVRPYRPESTQQASALGDFLSRLVDVTGIGQVLQKFPQIHIVVQPVPPRDYSVKINGRIYDATERALYGVAAGAIVMVRIERVGKPACDWSGRVSEDQVQTVTCAL
jgi:hypothetical protein